MSVQRAGSRGQHGAKKQTQMKTALCINNEAEKQGFSTTKEEAAPRKRPGSRETPLIQGETNPPKKRHVDSNLYKFEVVTPAGGPASVLGFGVQSKSFDGGLIKQEVVTWTWPGDSKSEGKP